MSDRPSDQGVEARLNQFLAAELRRAEGDFTFVTRSKPRSGVGTWVLPSAIVVAVLALAVIAIPMLVGAPPAFLTGLGRASESHVPHGASPTPTLETSQPAASPTPTLETSQPAVNDAALTTGDGQVFVRRTTDGSKIELVLQRNASSSIVLASVVDPVFASNSSSISFHNVYCPPATGLSQQFYAFGQTTSIGTITLHNVAGQTWGVSHGLYLIVFSTGSTPPPGAWDFRVGSTGNGAGGGSFISLPSYFPTKSAAGCYFDPT